MARLVEWSPAGSRAYRGAPGVICVWTVPAIPMRIVCNTTPFDARAAFQFNEVEISVFPSEGQATILTAKTWRQVLLDSIQISHSLPCYNPPASAKLPPQAGAARNPSIMTHTHRM
eukprot:1142927-Pelagomonas_calceolata.AAC.6